MELDKNPRKDSKMPLSATLTLCKDSLDEIPLERNQSLYMTLSPSGHLYLRRERESQEEVSTELNHEIKSILEFKKDMQISEASLLRFGITDFSSPLPSTLFFWHQFIQLFIQKSQDFIGLEKKTIDSNVFFKPSIHDLQALLDKAPFMQGSEYLSIDTLKSLWKDLIQALKAEMELYAGTLQEYLAQYNPRWKNVGRICFHLAENKSNPQKPFAFIGTYTKQLSSRSSLQHLPLSQALKEYSGDNQKLLSLLVPVKNASDKSDLIKGLLDSGDIFKPLAWGAETAYRFLKSISFIEEAGVVVRVPNWWKPQQPPRPQVNISIGNLEASPVGMDALLDFNMSYSLPDGTKLSEEEMQEILRSQEDLVHIKGQWVEVNQEKISEVLSHWQKVENQVQEEGLTFAQGIRLLASAPGKGVTEDIQETVSNWSHVIEGKWIKEVLSRLRDPNQEEDALFGLKLTEELRGTLRPYQEVGVKWLWWLYNLRLGGCLADDMGLGKTIQVLSLFLLSRGARSSKRRPHLLVLPASLLGNWQSEIKKFAPSLKIWIAHRSSEGQKNLKKDEAPDLSNIDLVMTTYSNVYRFPWMEKVQWDILILDEAQNIKNPRTKQARTIKKFKSQVRFIMTGTPIENRLFDLWSLFDFVAPGLLGSSKEFAGYSSKSVKKNSDDKEKERFYKAVRHLVNPYILRRLKSDKRIISDLPDKTEIDTHCFLTKQQAGLYQKSLKELQKSLERADSNDDMKRRGLVLSYLTRFKQICNHPNQFSGHGEFKVEESGKFIRLSELCEMISEKQEKVLVFTQYKEIIPALHKTLEKVFKRSGVVLHGKTPIKERSKLVDSFQQEHGPPFFILSIKAGGTGLNLTRASHVIHFDRWWNPAIENQATDRAYRIGQKKNVLVHKFICQGTIEEKIDALINSKKELSSDILSKNGIPALTEMDDESFLKVVSLDIHRAIGDSEQA